MSFENSQHVPDTSKEEALVKRVIPVTIDGERWLKVDQQGDDVVLERVDFDENGLEFRMNMVISQTEYDVIVEAFRRQRAEARMAEYALVESLAQQRTLQPSSEYHPPEVAEDKKFVVRNIDPKQ